MVSNIIDISESPSFELSEKEVFDLLVFSREGTVYLQTNKWLYSFLDRYHYAARELYLLLEGGPTEKLGKIDPIERIDPGSYASSEIYLCVDLATIKKAICASSVTSSWHECVVTFFNILIVISNERNKY